MTRIAIGAIMKQEAPYILEWVAYHKTLRFELIIADNGGTDDTTKILTTLDAAGIITRIDFRFLIKSPQIPAYRAIIRLAKRMKIEIIGFLDCDEFFAPRVPIMKLCPDDGAVYIESEFQKFNASQISYYGMLYGSRTDHQDMTAPVLERFSFHSSLENQVEDNKAGSIKSFITVKEMFKLSNILFLGPQVMSPHVFDGAMRKWIVDNIIVDPYSYRPQKPPVSHQNGIILHYMIKSWEEFQVKKARGGGIAKPARYANGFFSRFDLNNIYAPVDRAVIDKLRSEIDKLKKIVDAHHNQQSKVNFLTTLRSRLLSFGLSKYGHRKKYVKFRRSLSKQKYFMMLRISKIRNLISQRHND